MKLTVGTTSGIIGLILGLFAISKVIFAWGADQSELKKDVEYLTETSEDLKEDTEEISQFLIEQRVYNQAVTSNLENVTKILDKMSQ